MNKKILFSGMSILASLTLLAGSAYAAFLVNATSNGSTFSSGTPALLLCNDNSGSMGACAQQIPNPFNVSDLIPGTPRSFTFWMNNTGTDPLNPFTGLFGSPSGSGHGGTVGSFLEADLTVGIDCTAGGTTNIGAVSSSTLFSAWETGAQTFTGGSPLPAGGTAKCVMTVELPSGNTNDAAQTLNFNATFSGADGS